MLFLRWLTAQGHEPEQRRTRRSGTPPRRSYRPQVECLEGRCLPSTSAVPVTVTTAQVPPSGATTASPSFVPVAGLTATVNVTAPGGQVADLAAVLDVQHTTGSDMGGLAGAQLLVDGSIVQFGEVWLPGYTTAGGAYFESALPLHAAVALAPGPHTVSVRWASSTGTQIGARDGSLIVTQYDPFPSFATTTSISDQPVTLGADGAVTVTVSSAVGAPTGDVSLSVDGGSAVTQALSSGSATFTVAGPTAGSHTLSAVYAGLGYYAGSSATGSLVVGQEATSLALSAPTVTYNANGTITLTVSAGPGAPTLTGNVTLSVDGGEPASQALVNGQATFTIPSPGAGDHALSAAYAAQGDDAGSTATGTLKVLPATPTIVFAGPTLTYNGSPQGVGASAVGVDGVTQVNGTFSYAYYAGADTSGTSLGATAPTDAGAYTAVATFTSSDPNYSGASAQTTFAIQQAPLTVTDDDSTRAYGTANPAFTASYSGFVPDQGPADLAGALSFTTAATPASHVGTYAVTPGGLTSGNYSLTFVDGTLTVTPAPLTASGVNIRATAGAPFGGTVATFANADPFGSAASYSATIVWGDGSTSPGTITDSGGALAVSGAHTYADPVNETVQVTIRHVLGDTTTARTTATAFVTSLGCGIRDDQAEEIGFWHSHCGQGLIASFNGGRSDTDLSAWLASTFPNLSGAEAGSHDLTGLTNAQVATFFQGLFAQGHDNLDVQVLATALNVHASTALGRAQGRGCDFLVTAEGLGASSFDVRKAGAAFGVADGTRRNVFELLGEVNQQAVDGVLYDGGPRLCRLAEDLFERLNGAG